MYKIQRNTDYAWLLYDERYDGVAWIESDRTHKYFEDSFYFSFEQLEDLLSNLLKDEDVTIYVDNVWW